MSDLVEKVARAICEACDIQDGCVSSLPTTYDLLDSECQARAAILATLRGVRESTQGQIEAGIGAQWPGPEIVYADEFNGPEEQVCAGYSAMIDALIAEMEAGDV